MAFFKFRKGGDDQTAAATPAESVEAMRKRAKHRLIGTAILVLAGVIGFPLLVDRQPRPVAVDIPIEIPDRTKVKPLAVPSSTLSEPAAAAVKSDALPAPVAETAASSKPAPPTAVTAGDKAEALAPSAKPNSVPAPVAVPATTAATDTKVLAAPAVGATDEGARVQALLDGKEVASSSAAAVRVVVQVGAFADAVKVREVRQKLERAGFKTYIHTAETKEGRRIRVRVGPFGSRTEAEQAAEKIRTLELPTVILTL